MSDKSRRKLIKSIAAGSGAIVAGKSMQDNWVKPVVDSVVLPVHAQTSACAPIASASAGPAQIVDNTTFTLDIAVPASGTHTITQVTVDLDLTHTWVSDLDLTLTSPQGTTSELFSDVCQGGTDDMNLTLDDTSGNPLPQSGCGAGPVTGTYTTESGTGLSVFNGENPNGTWVLSVTDDATADEGTLNNVTLNISSTCV